MNQNSPESSLPKRPATMSAHDFAHWGVAQVAYVKAMVTEDRTVFGIFAADGQLLSVMDDPDVARAAARQNDLEPVSVH